jgi:hypothetical protein
MVDTQTVSMYTRLPATANFTKVAAKSVVKACQSSAYRITSINLGLLLMGAGPGPDCCQPNGGGGRAPES